jgi:hypothetical protein
MFCSMLCMLLAKRRCGDGRHGRRRACESATVEAVIGFEPPWLASKLSLAPSAGLCDSCAIALGGIEGINTRWYWQYWSRLSSLVTSSVYCDMLEAIYVQLHLYQPCMQLTGGCQPGGMQ